ncbi:electron transport complex, RnfABCDGE type, B subunit [Desulfocicer vacuolatum DSM 3385]|uniref:Ion-translocating oxidoreductase complex subunit B n=1 Tax=Desulfocicer vacuolatum DSM 3385 TaxID=1121400 RepID=A0A1W1YJY1_9BACT|nr:RnfABCDGE type electron transport complex subunit B [Desulfocicer vacuolatum]SMC36433.1 electron transport complex, RnfABCDGE type, B subunit [Desulfocicer vacuolatum DSM 3385]
MLESVFLMGGLGLLIGGVLAFASKIFYVYVDPLVAAIDDVLPGANCGGCGYPGCTPNAEAIASGKSSPDSCVAAGEDVAVAIAGLMGVVIGEKEPEVAKPGCYYGTKDADVKYLYDGIDDCRAAAMVFGGMKECNIGCLGLGTCVSACPFDALSMGEDGIPVVDEEKCTACGTCEKVCPKHIIRLTSTSRRIMREYTEDKCITPCQRACPTGIDIREYLAHIREGDNAGAVQVIKERNPFPTVIGRICPAPCESECRRQLVDESVGINNLKRFVCDLEMDMGERVLPYKAPETGRKVAILGGGVEGLSAAFFTARLGHTPTIFEATSTLGGLLRIAISDERLPQHVLDWDIDGILEMGVKVKTGKKAGQDVTIASLLKEGYETVFSSTGGWDSRLARGEIDTVANVFPGGYLMIDLLRSDVQQDERIPCDGDVVIVGGGKMAPEAVRVCREQGARSITVVERRGQADSAFDASSLAAMEADGATIIYTAGVTRVLGQDEMLQAVELTDIPTGAKNVVNADSLILSAGRFPELVFSRIEEAVEPSKDEAQDVSEEEAVRQDILPVKWEGVEIFKEPADNNELGMLSPADELSGYSAAVVAINGGRRAAATIHSVMYGVPVLSGPYKPVTGRSILQGITKVEGVQIIPRNIMPVNDAATRAVKTELAAGYTPETAKAEAERCLKCGLLCYERTLADGAEKAEESAA